VRKPEKATKPKLYYIDGDEAALVPSRAQADGQYMWSGGPELKEASNGQGLAAVENGNGSQHTTPSSQSLAARFEAPRRVYDVRPRKPIWGWPVVSYIWTKSIAAGGLLAAAAARFTLGAENSAGLQLVLGIVAMFFLIVTGVLLVVDLKQPKRFLYVLLRPQWQSWLVRGAYIITAYGAVLTLWLAAMYLHEQQLADVLLWPGIVLAILTAVYTAFLFGQAKGRDLWQNPLFSMHLLAHAVLGAGASWLLIDVASGRDFHWSSLVLGSSVGFSLIALLAECCTVPPTDDSRRAIHMIVGKPMGGWFWGAGVLLGQIVPLALLATASGPFRALAAVLALAGMGVIEWLWVTVPQRIPLS
jgi:formate-dependent nitrite reductase membrane component NrfD